jgi:hypothetical protein
MISLEILIDALCPIVWNYRLRRSVNSGVSRGVTSPAFATLCGDWQTIPVPLEVQSSEVSLQSGEFEQVSIARSTRYMTANAG